MHSELRILRFVLRILDSCFSQILNPDSRFGFERTSCVDSDSRFEIRKTLKILDSYSRFVLLSERLADSNSRFDPNPSYLQIGYLLISSYNSFWAHSFYVIKAVNGESYDSYVES